MRNFLILVLILFAAQVSRAQSMADSNYAVGRLHDAYGVRVGVVVNNFWNSVTPIPDHFDAPPLTSGARPMIDPYYEAPLTRGLTAAFDLLLVYRSFAVLDFSDTRFESYGFNGTVRWEPSVSNLDAPLMGKTHPYFAGSIGFDTYTDRVSISLSISGGELIPLSNTSELELAARITPQIFLGLGPGMFYGITAGIRFLNPL